MAFENLEVCKRSVDLSGKIYKELIKLKDYGFKDQVTRSGLSIPSNIAEGMERNSVKDTINFLSYAKGSCRELHTQPFHSAIRLIAIGRLPAAGLKLRMQARRGSTARAASMAQEAMTAIRA